MPIGESFESYKRRKYGNQSAQNGSIEQLDSQIDNATTRIQDAGFNAEDATDDRNAFEKFANLPKGQNFFFDTLELIGRPGNAIRNTIKNTVLTNRQGYGSSLYKGLSGKQNTSGSDLLKTVGITGEDTYTKLGRGALGFGLDVITDPTNLIPGTAISKGASKVFTPIKTGIKRGYEAVESAAPGLKRFRENIVEPTTQKVKDTFGKAFIPSYRYGDQLVQDEEGNILINQTKDQTLKNIRDQASRTEQFLKEESIRNVAKAANVAGLDEGTNVGRVMENKLEINKDAKGLVQDILTGRNVKLNIADGDPQDLVKRINDDLLSTPEVKQAARTTKQSISKIDEKLNSLKGINVDDVSLRIEQGKPVTKLERELFTEHIELSKSRARLADQVERLNIIYNRLVDQRKSTKAVERFINAREKQINKIDKKLNQINGITYRNAMNKVGQNAELFDDEAELMTNFNSLNQSKNKLQQRLENINRGVVFNPLTSESQVAKGEGFEIINPVPRLLKKAAGNINQFIRRISPTGTFEETFKKEYQADLKNVVDELIQNGQVQSPKLVEGSPLIDELKRVFGNDIKVTTNKKGSSVRLIQDNPNKKYYLLNQAKTEIPESLVNTMKMSDESIQAIDAKLKDIPNNAEKRVEIQSELNRISDEMKSIDEQKQAILNEVTDQIKAEYKQRNGVKILQDVEYVNSGKGTRVSENPLWFQIWFEEKNPKTNGGFVLNQKTGKKVKAKRSTNNYISQKEFDRIAKEMLNGNYGGIYGTGKSFNEMFGLDDAKQSLEEVASYLKNELDNLTDDVAETVKNNPIKNIPGKKYTQQDKIKAIQIANKNKNVNREISDLEREISVIRKEEESAIRAMNLAQKIKMPKDELKALIERSVESRSDYQEVIKRLDELNTAKINNKELLDFLRSETLNQGKLTVDDINFTNMLDLIRFDRPIRELSQSPIIHTVAKKFTDDNQYLLDYAREHGIDIEEIQGYMTHILSQEARKAKELSKGKAIGGKVAPIQPNKNVVKRRKYEGSAEDINELLDKVLFETNAFFSTAIGQKRLIEYIAAESAKRKILSNPNFAIPFKEGMSIPDDAVIISPDQFKFFKVDTPEGNQFLSLKKGDQYVVTRPVYELLQRYQKTINDEGINGILKGIDTVTGVFKRLALFSPGYHIRNVVGGMWNNYVGGMSAKDIGIYTSDATKEVVEALLKQNESDLYREYRMQGLGASSLNKIDLALPNKEPEDVLREVIEDKAKSTAQRINERINPLKLSSWKKSFETSREAGDFFDQINRFALYKWAREKNGLSVDQARDLVKAIQFDYTNLTEFERQVMVRIFPFYRWSRNNIPFQLQRFVSDPRKFMKLYYANQESKEESKIDQNKLPSYLQNTFNPIFADKKGGSILSLNLPSEDLSKIAGVEQVGKMFVDSLNPAFKLPIELVSNRNLFTNKEIEQFDGQRSPLGLSMKADYALQTLGGQPGRALSGLVTKTDAEKIANEQSVLRSFGIGRPFDPVNNERVRKIQDLEKLRDYIKKIEQDTGTKPRTINEINKGQAR